MVSFQGKYQALSALSKGEFHSFRGHQVSSGRAVLIHHLAAGQTPPPQPDLATLIFHFLRSAPPEESRHFVDMGEEAGSIYVVTADVPQCLDLRKWLQSVTGEHLWRNAEYPPSAEGIPRFENIELTRAFTSEALRHLLPSTMSEPVPTSGGPQAAQSAAPVPVKKPRRVEAVWRGSHGPTRRHRKRFDGVYGLLGEILTAQISRTSGIHPHTIHRAEKFGWSFQGSRSFGGVFISAVVFGHTRCSHRSQADSESSGWCS